MTKTEFNKLKNKCPWLVRLKDQPYCRAAQGLVTYHLLHCAKKNCAIIYWLTATSGNLKGGD